MKMNFFLSVVFVSLFLLSFSVGANVKLDSKNFSDSNFLSYVKTRYGVENGMFNNNAIVATKSIYCHEMGISDLTGVYSLNGIRLYRGRNKSIPVLVGAYVVKVDSTAKKYSLSKKTMINTA